MCIRVKTSNDLIVFSDGAAGAGVEGVRWYRVPVFLTPG